MPIDRDALAQLIALGRERNRARETRLGRWRYLRFDGKVRAMPEGAVVFGETVVWGYPKIGRIVQLDPGIRSQLRHPFWVEEKIWSSLVSSRMAPSNSSAELSELIRFWLNCFDSTSVCLSRSRLANNEEALNGCIRS